MMISSKEVKSLVGKSIAEVDAWIAEKYPKDVKIDKQIDEDGDVSYWVGGYWSDNALEIDFIDGEVNCVDFQGAWD